MNCVLVGKEATSKASRQQGSLSEPTDVTDTGVFQFEVAGFNFRGKVRLKEWPHRVDGVK